MKMATKGCFRNCMRGGCAETSVKSVADTLVGIELNRERIRSSRDAPHREEFPVLAAIARRLMLAASSGATWAGLISWVWRGPDAAKCALSASLRPEQYS